MLNALKITPAIALASVLVPGLAQADHLVDYAPATCAPPIVEPELPRFGMRTRNIGCGEKVLYVRRGGVAWRLGIQPGDVIVRLNRYPLDYRGSWEDALAAAMDRGGRVRLAIEDPRTGQVLTRRIDFPVYTNPVEPRPTVLGYRGQFVAAPPVTQRGVARGPHRDHELAREGYRDSRRDRGVSLTIGGGSSQFRFRLP